jgi:hypothetical protein
MISKAKQEHIITAITDGYSLVKACLDAKVSRATLYRYMSKDKELDGNVKQAQRQAAEKALEELEDMYGDALHGRKSYDPNLLRDYGHHVRWKVQKILPERFGEAKNRTGVEISDGSLRIIWETGTEDAS